MTHKGIDISNWQSDFTAYNLLKAQGIDFVIAKLTEGQTFTDKNFSKHYNACRAAGVPVGAYIFSHASYTFDVHTELAHALEVLSGRELQLPLFLDMEDNGSLNSQTVAEYFGKLCTDKGIKWGIYANASWWTTRLNASKIKEMGGVVWCAHYGVSAPGISNADIWQYTNCGKIAGYAHDLDMNYLYNDELLAKDSNVPSNDHFRETAEMMPATGNYPKDPSIVILQMVMQYNGYWDGDISGYKSKKFFEKLREFTNDMEEC